MNSRLLAFVTPLLAFVAPCLFGQSKTYSSSDGPPTPSQATPGASGSIDSVDYYSGSVAMRIPLTAIGGRGHADMMTVPIFRQWSVTESTDADGNNRSFAPESTPSTGAVGLGYSPGYVTMRSSSRRPNSCYYDGGQGSSSWVGLGPFITWIVWHRSAGSETVLVDAQYEGSPQGYGVANCVNLNSYKLSPTNRGRIFKATDGSNLVFVATADVTDQFYPGDRSVAGTLYFPDGTHLIISDQGLPPTVVDRNGNQSTYQGTNTNPNTILYTISDSAGRTETVQLTTAPAAGNSQDVITYPGNVGHIYVNYDAMSNLLAPGESTKTFKCLFPVLDGSSMSTFDTWVVSSVVLANGKSYQFKYNAYGEVARVDLPTGGAYTYRYKEASDCSDQSDNGGAFFTTQNQLETYVIRRRLQERDELADGTNVSAKMVFAAPTAAVDSNHPTRGGTMVQVDFEDAAGTILREEKHYYYGDPTKPDSMTKVFQEYANWAEGLEFKTEIGAASTVLQTQLKAWGQRPCAAGENCPVAQNDSVIDPQTEGAPRHDNQMCQANTSLDSTSASNSGVVYGYDQFNNIRDLYEFDYGTAPSIGANCPSLLGGLTGYARYTQTTYKTDPNYVTASITGTVNLVGLPVFRTVFEGGGNPAASERWGFDDASSLQADAGLAGHDDVNYGAGNTVRGNITSHSVWLNTPTGYAAWYSSSSGALTESKTYYTTGNVHEFTDSRGKKTTYTYGDSRHVFPTTVTNALQQSAQFTYDPGTLALTDSKDANNIETQYVYNDALDRLKRVIRGPSAAQTTYQYVDTPNGVSVTTSSDKDSWDDNVLQTKVLYDGLGRTQETQQTADCISVQQSYDAMGRPYQTSNPFRPCKGETPIWTITTYDSLGRVLSVKTPDLAVSTNVPLGNQATTTDPAGVQRITVSDAEGRLVSVTEAGSAVTHYRYDALDNLTKVCQGADFDPSGNCTASSTRARLFAYDSLKRLTSTLQPESGITAYQYDNNGNLLTKTDSKGNSVTMGYDDLDRVTSKTYSGSATPNVTFCYDGNVQGVCAGAPSAGANVKGHLTWVSSSPSSSAYSQYNNLGRLTASGQTTGTGSPYNFIYDYDLAGNVTKEQYPSLRTVWNTYDPAGRLCAVANSQGQACTGSGPYASSVTYAPHGAIAGLKLKNGVSETWAYNTRLQPCALGVNQGNPSTENTPCTLTAPNGATPLLSLTWGYGSTTNNNGNVLSQTITPGTNAAINQVFRYDAYNRLTLAVENPPVPASPACTGTGSGTWCEQYTYTNSTDVTGQFGNRKENNYSLGGFPSATDFDVKNRNAPNTACLESDPGTGWRYDCVGNVVRDSDGRTYAYDAENRQVAYCPTQSNPALCTPTWASGNTVYGYDGEGRRVQEKRSDGTVVTFVYDAGGQLMAEYGGSATAGMQYLTVDNLGSTRMLTDGTGVPLSRMDYLPFGVQMPSSVGGRSSVLDNAVPTYFRDGGVGQKFTGQERDAETGLDYFSARYLASAQGRFTSADEPFADQDSVDPQSWNLYSYVRNNPLANIDPTGRDCITQSGAAVDVALGQCGGAGAYVPGTVDMSSLRYSRNTVTYSYAPYGGGFGEGVIELQHWDVPLNSSGQDLYNRLSTNRDSSNAMIGFVAGGSVALGTGVGLAVSAAGLTAGAGLTVVNLQGAAQAAALMLPPGVKLAQMISRSGNPQFIGNPQAFLSYARQFVEAAVKQGTYAAGNYISKAGSIIYRVGNDFLTVARDGRILSYVQSANAGGVAAKYSQLGGR